ncbi:MAG: PSP1 domain-containing protein [Elusimicrobiota bacterium]
MKIVTVALRKLCEYYPAEPGRKKVSPGASVLLSTDNGLETGRVISKTKDIEKDKVSKKIIRKLNKNDYGVLKENRKKAEQARPKIRREIERQNLNMKVTKINYTYDRQKLYIYYTAESRVDFRELIRVLGRKLKVRIQMVQIGVRDEVSLMGGIGLCGREVCCSKFLKDIKSVNLDMARKQNLSINPENITGCCGRLLCCLRFENQIYEKEGNSRKD